MPPLPSVSRVLRIAMNFTDDVGQPLVSRFFFAYTGSTPTGADLVTFAEACDSAFAGDPIGDMSAEITEVGCVVTDLSSPTSAEGISTAANVGGLTGGKLPADAAFLTSYEILRRYRGGHPRGYWPLGDDTKLLDNGHWTTDFVTVAESDVNAMLDSIHSALWGGAASLTHVNVSYFNGFTVVTSPTTGRARNVPTLRADPLVDGVASVVGRQRIASQRRRLGR